MNGNGSNLAAFEHAQRQNVRGDVAFDAGSRALYTDDASNYRRAPDGVVVRAAGSVR